MPTPLIGAMTDGATAESSWISHDGDAIESSRTRDCVHHKDHPHPGQKGRDSVLKEWKLDWEEVKRGTFSPSSLARVSGMDGRTSETQSAASPWGQTLPPFLGDQSLLK